MKKKNTLEKYQHFLATLISEIDQYCVYTTKKIDKKHTDKLLSFPKFYYDIIIVLWFQSSTKGHKLQGNNNLTQ